MAKYPSEEQERFIVRMPEGMRDSLKAHAEMNQRSMNAEIVARLTESLDVTKGVAQEGFMVGVMLNELERIVDKMVDGTVPPPENVVHIVANNIQKSFPNATHDEVVQAVRRIRPWLEGVPKP